MERLNSFGEHVLLARVVVVQPRHREPRRAMSECRGIVAPWKAEINEG